MKDSQRYIVRVKGNITAKDGTIQNAQEWVCFGSSSQDEEDNYSPQDPKDITTNLYFNEDRACIPYAIYISEKGICGSGITFEPGYGPAIKYAKSEINRIKTSLNIEVPQEIQRSYYKGLYIECFSCLEQFLCDFVLCGIYNVEGCYEKAEQYLNNKKKDLHTYFFKFVYHNFKTVSKMFNEVLGIQLPDMSYFKDQNSIRNDIVHRTSLMDKDRMTYRFISSADVQDMIIHIESLLNDLSVYG